MARRRYRQACNIAHTLDLVGERWTLLIVRELFTGPRRYGQLLEILPSIGTNLLADRLKQLEADGIIGRGPSSGLYELTEAGRLLQPVLIEMIRFGLAVGLSGEASDVSRPAWTVLSAKATFHPERTAGLDEHYEFHVGEDVFYLGVRGGEPDHGIGQARNPAVVATMDTSTFDSVIVGSQSLRDAVAAGEIEVDGDPEALERMAAIYQRK